MEQYKIEIYEEETGKKFPETFQLEKAECNIVIKNIAHITNFKVAENIFSALTENLNYYDIDDDLEITDVINNVNFKDKFINIIWRENQINRVSIDFLEQYWNFIWYPTSDEAVILFFPISEKIVMLTDFNRVYYN